MHLFNGKSSLMGTVPQNQLLQVEECSFMGHPLSDLNLSSPGMGSVCLLTVIALKILNNELYLKGLL